MSSIRDRLIRPVTGSNMMPVRGHEQAGIAYVEYVVVTLGMVIVLFAPLPGLGGEAVFDLVMDAIRNYGRQSTLLMSLP